MSRRISYYFTLVSPWAYFGHARFVSIAREHDVAIDWKPVHLGQIFPETGGLPLAKRAPARQRYRIMELQRWRDKRGLPLNVHPKHWPFDCALADRIVVAIVASGQEPTAYIGNAFKAVFAEERDCADERVLSEILNASGYDAAPLVADARSAQSETIYKDNIAEALAAGVFGSPTYILGGELFWGQDRLDLLQEALQSGRKPYSAEA